MPRGITKYIESKKSLFTDIQQCDVAAALQEDKQFCVLGQAIRRNDPLVVDVRVGATITTIWRQGRNGQVTMTRFKTTTESRKKLSHFDMFGVWPFELGKNLVAGPIDYANRLDRERVRVRKARSQGKCLGSGVRAKFGPRKTARTINPRHFNFSQVIRNSRATLLASNRSATSISVAEVTQTAQAI